MSSASTTNEHTVNDRTNTSPRQHQIPRVIFSILFLMFCCAEPTPSIGQTTPQERRLINLIPRHLPLKIEIRSFDNENWLREVEVEVTNISDKPIYYLKLFFTLLGVKGVNGNDVGFPLRYGRADLIRLDTVINSDDIAIQPGEIHVLKVADLNLRGWEQSSIRKNLPDDEPKKVWLEFAYLNFGDGTGFSGTDAQPFDLHKKKAGRQ